MVERFSVTVPSSATSSKIKEFVLRQKATMVTKMSVNDLTPTLFTRM